MLRIFNRVPVKNQIDYVVRVVIRLIKAMQFAEWPSIESIKYAIEIIRVCDVYRCQDFSQFNFPALKFGFYRN